VCFRVISALVCELADMNPLVRQKFNGHLFRRLPLLCSSANSSWSIRASCALPLSWPGTTNACIPQKCSPCLFPDKKLVLTWICGRSHARFTPPPPCKSYALAQATVGVGTVLVSAFCVPITSGGGGYNGFCASGSSLDWSVSSLICECIIFHITSACACAREQNEGL